MGRPVFKWLVVYEDGKTQVVENQDNILDALEQTEDGGYEAIAVIRLSPENYVYY